MGLLGGGDEDRVAGTGIAECARQAHCPRLLLIISSLSHLVSTFLIRYIMPHPAQGKAPDPRFGVACGMVLSAMLNL